MTKLPENQNTGLFNEIEQYIVQSKSNALQAVNRQLSVLNWKVGQRIQQEILQNKRASYGKQLIKQLSNHLRLKHGRGWSTQQLRHCIQFYKTFNTEEKLYAVSRELTWTHLRSLIYIDDALKRSFYIELTKLERWSVRRMQERIKSML